MMMDLPPGKPNGHVVQTPGLHRVPRRLADGTVRLHFYAWRGGPRITAAPGTPEFVAEFQRLTATRDVPTHHAGTLQHIITTYQQSQGFLGLAPSTRQGYARRIRKIEAEFGDLPIRALANPETRGIMLDWRDGLALKSPREADYHAAILQAILSWAWDRRRIPAHPLQRPGRVWRGSRVDNVWSDADEAALMVMPAHLRLPGMIALHTGQREGDVLRLTWSAYDGQSIRLRQGKTGRRVVVPVTATLKAELDATPRRAVTICLTSRGTPWTLDGFKSSWGKEKPAGVTFHDLRGTAVTRLARAGCTTPEIAAITGHSLKAVETILDRHYLHRDQSLSESAIAKLEKHRPGTGTVNGPVNGS
jgi:integrase